MGVRRQPAAGQGRGKGQGTEALAVGRVAEDQIEGGRKGRRARP